MADHPSLEQAIERVTSLMAEMESQAFQQEGFSELSVRQVFYLDTIIHLRHPSFSELAEALGITRPSVTAIVSKLIRKGYVQKAQDDKDRRSFHIILTQKGKDFTKVHKSMHQLVAQSLTARLNESEIEQLTALIHKAVGG